MAKYFFKDSVSSSKSLFNRALIIQSFNPYIELVGQSDSDDVKLMQAAVQSLGQAKEFECGHAGTVLRFLAFRLSRLKGRFILKGSKRLFSRPQDELVKLLSQLGSDVETSEDFMQITADGWRVRGDGIFVDGNKSSQFASGILLNAWDLEKDFFFQYDSKKVSEAYFRMTLELVKQFGLKVEQSGNEFMIKAGQKPLSEKYQVEPDISSAFSIAALAMHRGAALIENFPQRSLQPDIFFLACLQEMQVPFVLNDKGLEIQPVQSYRGLDVNLNNAPDLFPVLSALCVFASSDSYISGVEHLRFKESDRIEKAIELIDKLGGNAQYEEGLFKVTPTKQRPQQIQFDADQDHRQVMAAAVAKAAGVNVKLTGLEAVSKSFPEFIAVWDSMQ